MGMNSGGIVF